MEKLPSEQQQQLKKMSDERLRTKLVAHGYPKEVAEALGRDELLARYSEVIGLSDWC